MNESPESILPPAEPAAPQPEAMKEIATLLPTLTVNPNLSAALRETYDAVQEHLRQANDLAADMERQLAGKSKEVLHLRFLFDQTKTNLTHMQDSIVALRKERHKLANEAMRARGLEIMLARANSERDRLRSEIDGVLEGLAAQNAKKMLSFDEKDRRIAELTFELIKAQQAVAELRRTIPGKPAPTPDIQPSQDSTVKIAWDTSELEIVPTEQPPGRRGKA